MLVSAICPSTSSGERFTCDAASHEAGTVSPRVLVWLRMDMPRQPSVRGCVGLIWVSSFCFFWRVLVAGQAFFLNTMPVYYPQP